MALMVRKSRRQGFRQRPSRAAAATGEKFQLYHNDEAGALLANIPEDFRSFNLASLGLAPGTWELALRRVDAFGTPSVVAVITVPISSGGAIQSALLAATSADAWPATDGRVRLVWFAIPEPGDAQPAEWEIADAADLATILATVTGDGRRFYETIVSDTGDVAFANGATVRLRLRASDGVALGGGGQRGPWVAAPAVVADSEAPEVPEVQDDD